MRSFAHRDRTDVLDPPGRAARGIPLPALLAICLPGVLPGCGGDGGPTEPEPAPEPTTGALRVSTGTSGVEPDPDGYTVLLDGDGESAAIGAADTLLLADLPEGEHSVELTNVQENCSLLEQGNPRTVTVVAADTASTHFAFSCPGRSAIEVTTSTVAGGLDGDGYRVAVDGEGERTIGTDEVDLFTGLASGEHTVDLSDLASGCSVEGANPRTVTAPANDTASVDFQVACGLRNRIAWSSDRGGNDDIHVMDPDGTNVEPLTANSADDTEPAVSPDGSLVAFASDRSGNWDIWVVEADGTNPRQVTSNLASDRSPAWSPDGDRIAFESDRGGSVDTREIWVIQVDGTAPGPVTDDEASDRRPAWSPDGSLIAFESDRDGPRDIWLVAPDGSGLTNLTQNPALDGSPAWSPDGYKIAFDRWTSESFEDVYTVCANGANSPEQVTDAGLGDFDPHWSPDGDRIVFTSVREGASFEVYVIDSDGLNPVNLTVRPDDDDWKPTWSPGSSGSGGFPTPPPECQLAAP